MPKKFTRFELEERAKGLIALFEGCTTIGQVAKKLGVTKQCVEEKFKRFGVLGQWKQHVKNNKGIFYNIPKCSAVYYLYFIEKPEFKYYGATKNLRLCIIVYLSKLKKDKHHSIKLQYLFNKYGLKSFRYKIVKETSKNQLIAERRAVKKNKNCLNIFFLKTKEDLNCDRFKDTQKRYAQRKILPFKKSKYKFICWSRMNQKWHVQVPFKKDGKFHQINLGFYSDINEAKRILDKYLILPKMK